MLLTVLVVLMVTLIVICQACLLVLFALFIFSDNAHIRNAIIRYSNSIVMLGAFPIYKIVSWYRKR